MKYFLVVRLYLMSMLYQGNSVHSMIQRFLGSGNCKLVHSRSSNNKYRHFYFNRLPRLSTRNWWRKSFREVCGHEEAPTRQDSTGRPAGDTARPHVHLSGRSHPPRLLEVTSLPTWCYCFLGFVATMTAHPITSDLLENARIIKEAQRQSGIAWLDYDKAIQADPSTPWNTINPSLLASTMLGQQFCPSLLGRSP